MELYSPFPDVNADTAEKKRPMIRNDDASVLDQLMQAIDENRLVMGVYECTLVLENDPDSVQMCVLPVTKSSDIVLQIQHKLIEAYCWENEILFIKVAKAEDLTQYLQMKGKISMDDSLTCMIITDSNRLQGGSQPGLGHSRVLSNFPV
ncbi:hypothetical protein CHS0354_010746 [Potamilus streckersoni]|uniref:Ribosomal protein eL8/eL30/eS12/Gadd45 domain-containing protein n=1 Tax=Potamilus streckersoni TaxID=2493646 RepID=A0AAE0W983_9BIVA|nr:hypothetical protein CHS0354_010746 [Potamilus streckersoni]